jgi:Ca2+-binding EF-hand superfamily protein
MVRVLTDPSAMGVQLLPDDWSPLAVLRLAACAHPPRRALIDTGALVTGLSNAAAAAYLLHTGLRGCDACVYLDSGRKLVMRRGEHERYLPGGTATSAHVEPLLLERCGVPPDRRFVFFDHVHTTGTDIEIPPHAIAALTVSKDVTFRDLAQGAFRMRRVGRGQKVDLMVPPEIAKLIRIHAAIGRGEAAPSGGANAAGMLNAALQRNGADAPGGEESGSDTANGADTVVAPRPSSPPLDIPSFLRDTCAWAVVNGLASESLQLARLCQQSLRDVWRVAALRVLLRAAEAPPPPTATENSRTPAAPNGGASLLRLLDVFCERLTSEVANSVPDAERAADILDREARGYAACLSDGGAALDEGEREALGRLRARALACATGGLGGIDVAARGSGGVRGRGGVTSLAAAAAERELLAEVVAEGEAEQEVEQTHEQLAEEELAVAPHDDFPRDAWARDAPPPKRWPLSALRSPPGDELSVPFYPARRFRSSRMAKLGVAPLRLPDFVLVSPNLTPLLPGSRPRRLKNVTLTLDWVPDREALQPARDLMGEAAAPLTVRQEDRLRDAFRMFDRDGDGRLDREDLISVLRAVDVNLGGGGGGSAAGLLKQVAAVVVGGAAAAPASATRATAATAARATGAVAMGDEEEEGEEAAEPEVPMVEQILGCVTTQADGRASLDQLREALQSHAFYRLRTGRFLVAISLPEAEAVRAALHAARAGGPSPLAAAPRAEIGLRHRGIVLDATPGFRSAVAVHPPNSTSALAARGAARPAGASDFLGAIGHQCLRFLDSALQYELDEGHLLLRALQSNSMTHRRDVFSLVRHCRRRRHADWRQHTVARLFTTEDEFQLLHLRAMLARARRLMARRRLSPEQFFAGCDRDRDGCVSWSELHMGLRALGLHANSEHAMELFLFLRQGALLAAPAGRAAGGDADGGPPLLSQRHFLEAVAADAGALGGEWHDDDMGGGDLGAGDAAGEGNEPPPGTDEPARAPQGGGGAAFAPVRGGAMSEGNGPPPGAAPAEAIPALPAVPAPLLPPSALRARLVRVADFACVWDSVSAGGGGRSRASIWAPALHATSLAESLFRPACVRVCLGHYASTDLAKPGATAGVVRLPVPRTLEIVDRRVGRWRLPPADTSELEAFVAAALPPPVRFTLRWSKRLAPGGAELYAWEGVPPPGHAALGALCTGSADPPPVDEMRCVPLAWLVHTTAPPIKVWDDAGAGGARGSVWVVNTLGMLAVVPGHDPPRGPFYELDLDAMFAG